MVFTYNTFPSNSSLYICNYFYIAFPEVSDSTQIPEMLFCLQQMLREECGISKDPVSLVTFSKFACQHGAIHHQRHSRPVHGEQVLEVNNLCILSFCFEYMDEKKIVVNTCIVGDRQAEKLSPGRAVFGNEISSFIRLGKGAGAVVERTVHKFGSSASLQMPTRYLDDRIQGDALATLSDYAL